MFLQRFECHQSPANPCSLFNSVNVFVVLLEQACRARAADFSARSTAEGAFDGCVGAVDGIFIRTRAFGHHEVDEPRSFYSGHKKSFGINLQVICDAKCRILDASCISPGYILFSETFSALMPISLCAHFIICFVFRRQDPRTTSSALVYRHC